jgi:NDP-sugar pyrophosphorylase family protein
VRHPVKIGASAHIGEGAIIGPHTVIGSRANVESGAVIERSVVWRGAHARGRLHDAIVTPEGVIDLAAATD